VNEQPAMVKIDAEGKLVVRRETIEELIGRPYDLQELQVNLITISGNLDQTDDEMILYWNA
jgi:phenol hydroxylase P2 protein